MPEPVVWGLHMRRQHGLEPLSKGYVAIGWHELGDLSTIPANRDAFKARVAAGYPGFKPGAVPIAAGVLYRFCVEMQIGDIVIFPSKSNREINIGTIESGYLFDKSGLADWPNRRKVTWVRSLPRASFSQTALNEIGSALTLFRVTTHVDEFLAAMAGKKTAALEIDEVSAVHVSIQVEETTEDFIVKRLKGALTPYEFEHFVAHLLTCIGYHARVTQQSSDGGIDIIAHRDELGFEPPIIKVQCKQMLGTHGRPEVQQLTGAIENGEHGLFVTLGSFAPAARTFERTKPNLRLVDGSELIELVYANYHKFEPRYQVLLPLKRVYIPSPASTGTDSS